MIIDFNITKPSRALHSPQKNDRIFCLRSRTISNLEENETKERAELALQRELEDKFALLSLSYVEYLDGDCLFQQMFSRDEGKTYVLSFVIIITIANTQTTKEEKDTNIKCKNISTYVARVYDLSKHVLSHVRR